MLHIISASAGALTPVFKAIVKSAVDLCGARFGAVFRMEGDLLHLVTDYNFGATQRQLLGAMYPMAPNRGHISGRAILNGAAVQIQDIYTDEDYKSVEAKKAGFRSLLAVPLLLGGRAIGSIVIYRTEPGAFTARQSALLEGFAAQAVIAIENTRLLTELRQSLQQQTATADVLKVISRSTFDLQAVLDTLVESATRLCEAQDAFIFLPSGDAYHVVARYGFTTEAHEFIKSNPIPIERGSVVGRTAIEGRVVHISDVLTDPEYTLHDAQKISGYRATLGVPLLRERNVVGVIFLTRTKPQPFTEKQIELVETFADQAAIAIENVRLFEDVQKRTNDLAEALQQQTATADVLKVISRSTFDLGAVLQTLVESAARLCDADKAVITRERNGAFYRAETYGFSREFMDYVRDIPIKAERGSASGRVLLEGRVVHIADVKADPEYTLVEAQRLGDFRTIIGVPMLREGAPIGVLTLTRSEVRPFTNKQIELVTTFADQAAIAIENVRLLNELRESLRQQTATSDVLKTISRSTFKLQTVLDTLVESAARLCDADSAAIYRPTEEGVYRHQATYGYSSNYVDYMQLHPLIPNRGSVLGRAVFEQRAIHVEDVLADPNYQLMEQRAIGGYRSVLGVPLMREGSSIGVIMLSRNVAKPFTGKQIELVTTFADQAAIAIENTRLFEAEQQRTRELAKSLEDLRTAQDRLVQTQKLASLGQLTAGIAHEIKNPLNFVNNFSGVSVELIDELQETVEGVGLGDKVQAEIIELTTTLRDNLDKIVQHGKRADAIVKNMLLHSREGSGEHRPVNINSIVEESLNLAYHGARAEKQGFTLTLERSFDPAPVRSIASLKRSRGRF